jgi:hypothetical protein
MEGPHDPQERDLTTILLDRLNKIEGQRKDPEAETLIRETTAERVDAPYSLVQTVLIQDLSLHNAQSRITNLESQLTETNIGDTNAFAIGRRSTSFWRTT